MKIKIPGVLIETSQKCPCNQYNEYELKLRCMRMKLHSRYIACISIGIVIWFLATSQANTPKFMEWISFASTIASIILSVIAIIMSITGENKTDAIRNQMEHTSERLKEVADSIDEANNENRKNISELKENINILQVKIEKMPGQMTKAFEQYEKSKNTQDDITNNINETITWVNKDE